MIFQSDYQAYDLGIFYQLMAVLLWVVIFVILINNWQKIVKYKQTALAISLSAFITISGVYLMLVGFRIFTNSTPYIIGFIIYAFYLAVIFIAGMFTYYNTWYSSLQRRKTGEFQDWGPYVQFGKDAATELYISWESISLAIRSQVVYSDSEKIINEFPELKNKVLVSDQKFPRPVLHFCHYLTNLKPNTKYYYRISRDDFKIIYTFQTGLLKDQAINQSYEFVVLSDLHSTQQDLTRALFAMESYAQTKRFVVAVGDSVSQGENENSWRNLMYQLSPYTSNTAWMHLAGDYDTKNHQAYHRFIATFDQPYENIEWGAYFSWDFGNIHCIMLDSQNAGTRSDWITDSQMEWLEQDLEKNTKPNKDRWIFVFIHHAIFSTGAHGFNKAFINWLSPVLKQYHVDMVFSGHDHHFEAFHVDKEEVWGGTHYFVVGGSGKLDSWLTRSVVNPIYLWEGKIHKVSEQLFEAGLPNNPARADDLAKNTQIIGLLMKNFTKVLIKGNEATVQSISFKGETLWEKTIKKNG